MSDYVELDRLFIDYDESDQVENESTSFVDYLLSAQSWNQVLEGRCTVVIAEAGTGKSEEFRQQTRKLIADGKPAFYAALDLLAKLPLRTALTIGTAADFDVWQAGEEHGYFFLDAVDEAKLVDPRDFAVAIANFASAAEAGKGRYSLVVSTRPHAWQANADRTLLAERLDLKPGAEYTRGKETLAGSSGDVDAVDESNGAETSETRQTPPVSVVRLAGLSTKQVKTFAKAKGVDYPDDFITAIEQANAEVFATRPADLPGLIALWRRDGKIGKYSDVVRYNVEMKLAEQNPAYKGRGIALEHAKLGAQALAAAATFSGQISFLLPDESISEKVKSSSIDPREVLQSWSSEETNALLSTALFDESLYGTVRFHHRTAREYLCACWLARLMDKRKNRRKVEELLFARPYGTERLVVRPAMKPVAAWLALTDQDIRDQVMNVDPRVLLEHGDASALDIGTRGSLLKLVADRYRDRNHTPIRMDRREVRRLADKRMTGTLRALFEEYRNHVDVRHLLLRLAREGTVAGFESVAFSYLADASVDAWTKILAVQVITATGSAADKKRLSRMLLKKPPVLAREVVGHALEGLVPAYVSWKELVQVLGEVPANAEFSSDQLNLELGTLLEGIQERPDKLNVLADLQALLATPPLHSEFARISTRYDWLLPAAGELACSIARSDKSAWSNAALLSVLSMCQQGDHLQRYTGDIHQKSSAVIAESRDLKHLLFWHEVRGQRQSGLGPVVDWWRVTHLPSLRGFDALDFERFVSSIRERDALEDQRTALSAAFAAWAHSGRIAEKLEELRSATAGNAILFADLERLISPPPPDEAMRKALVVHEEMERESGQERKKRADEKQKWIRRLKSNPSQVGDLSIASEGKIWNNTLWLFDEARKAQKKNTTWTVTDWRSLVPKFGEEVASRFRDFCKQFWRIYRPQVRSEYAGGDHSTPSTVIVGLSGIAMDWDGSSSWAQSLSASEAELAARYALWELNGFPDWFNSLHEAHTAVVDQVLLAEARWELETPSQGSRNYVLSRLRWSNKPLGEHLSAEIADLVRTDADLTDYAVREAIIVILANGRRPPQGFIDTAHNRADRETNRRALWIAVLLALDGSSGLIALNGWLESASGNEERAAQMLKVLDELFNDDRSGVAVAHKAFVNVPVLSAMLEVLYATPSDHASKDDDEGGYRSRNSSRGRREYLLELLSNIPGRETFDALIALAGRAPEHRDYLLVLAERRAEQDSDAPSWSPSDVHLFASDVERSPRTEEELFRISLSRLDDLKHEYERGDESEASLLRKVSDEVELRKVIANRLKLAARSTYTTGSEEELADGKRTDIRIHHPAVDSRVPIEIKIAGQWRPSQLKERLKNQLVGQYMRESNYGIFLLVNRGGSNDKRRWRLNGKLAGLPELEGWLQKEAKAYQRRNSRVSELEVTSIDLLKLGSNERASPSRKATVEKKVVAKRGPKKATLKKKN